MGNHSPIGGGVVNWSKSERVDDKYSAIKLYVDTTEIETINLNRVMAGKNGRLIALVQESRNSYHVGDSFREIYPTNPAKGERIVLGEGMLFFEIDETDGSDIVGIVPRDMRGYPWMNVSALYRVHFQTVALFFEEI